MSLIVPNVLEEEILNHVLNTALTLRLYGNNYVPIGLSAVANYNEIAGGGYANKPLTWAHWSILQGDPTVALYDTQQQWTFTGAINAPATIYGYYVTRDSDGKLMWSERFAAGLIPFSPINGSIIKVTPRFADQSTF